MKNDRLPKIVLFCQVSRARRTEGCPRFGWEDKVKFKINGVSWDGAKREVLDRLEWRRSVRSFVGLRWLGAAVIL